MSQIILPGKQNVIHAFEFDGFVFPVAVKPDHLSVIEIAYRARRGDVNAMTVLNGFGANIKDLRGESYWPIPEPERVAISDPPGGES